MPTYTTTADVKAYTTLDALEALADVDVAKLIDLAERDVDQALGARAVGDNGLKIAPLELDTGPRRTLNRATCAQVEYRFTMGPEFFIRAQYAEVTGPEFSTKGTLPRVGPAVWDELAGSDLLKLTTSWGGRDVDPPWRDFAYG